MKRLLIFPAMVVFLFGVEGCDDFSLLDLFSRGGGPLSLALQTTSVQQGQTINLYPNGGSPPYSFALITENLAISGTIGTISNQTYTAGDAIGSVMIVLTDSAGGSANSVVTIVPPTPGSFSVAKAGTNSLTLSWTYGSLAISGFQIWQSANGGAFSLAASPATGTTSYTIGSLNQNWVYSYQVYAVAGSFLSIPTPVQSAQP